MIRLAPGAGDRRPHAEHASFARTAMKNSKLLLLLAAFALVPQMARAQDALSLKLNWDHCEGEGRVADRSFACDVNTGSDVLYASLVINDGVDRTGVSGVVFYVDVTSTASSLPDWWLTNSSECRQGAFSYDTATDGNTPGCPTWSGVQPTLGVLSIQYRTLNGLMFNGGAALPAPTTVALPAGQELLVCRIAISHTKSTGATACSGCTVPTCIGFGRVLFIYEDNTYEEHVGDASSTVTWQGAYVAGYAPVPAHPYGGGIEDYRANLDCATGAVPAQNRTWGTIKTLYR